MQKKKKGQEEHKFEAILVYLASKLQPSQGS